MSEQPQDNIAMTREDPQLATSGVERGTPTPAGQEPGAMRARVPEPPWRGQSAAGFREKAMGLCRAALHAVNSCHEFQDLG